jgi:hypothetical protein
VERKTEKFIGNNRKVGDVEEKQWACSFASRKMCEQTKAIPLLNALSFSHLDNPTVVMPDGCSCFEATKRNLWLGRHCRMVL